MRLATLERLQLPNTSIRIMADVLRSVGKDPRAAAVSAGIDPDLLDNDLGMITGAQEVAFQRAFVAMTPDDHALWLATGQRYHMLAYGNLGIAMMTAKTLGEAIAVSTRLGDFLYSLMLFRPIVGHDGLPGMDMDPVETPPELITFSTLRDITAVMRANADLWGTAFQFQRLELALPESFRPALEAHVTAPLTFDAPRTAWFWAAGLDQRPLSLSNEQLHASARKELEALVQSSQSRTDLADQIASLMISREMRFSLHEAASLLRLSDRTLQRRLSEKGLRFRQFVHVVRQRMASQLLVNTRLSIEAIAWRVGYADASAFTHAFRKHTGETPGQFRRSNAGKSAPGEA
jgi:AraC-like DNA-binding protein